MTSSRRLIRAGVAAATLSLLTVIGVGCSSGGGGRPSTSAASSTSSVLRPLSTTTTTPTPTPTASASTSAAPPRRQLPMGGTTILGKYRLIAYYGAAGNSRLGVLGSADPGTIAGDIADRASEYDNYGLPVQPTMELLASVADGGPGPSGTYSHLISQDIIRQYLDVAHEHKMILILDFQPGRGEFLPQVESMADIVADPSVSVALDPEWKVTPAQVPGTVIGSSSAASVNAVRDYLSDLISRDHLPDKLLMVHEFTPSMLPDRGNITPKPGVEVTFHADGFGSQNAKFGSWQRLAFPGRAYGVGFKLFLQQDIDMMSPAQVMALTPRPDVVTYE